MSDDAIRGGGLERRWRAGFLWAVIQERLERGIWAGCVAAAACTGVLVGFGFVRGRPARVLNALATPWYGTRALAFDSLDLAVSGVALLMLIGIAVLWGIVVALVAGALQGLRLFALALVTAAVAMLLHHRLLPDALRPGFATILSVGEVTVFWLVLALALALGLSLTRSSSDTVA